MATDEIHALAKDVAKHLPGWKYDKRGLDACKYSTWAAILTDGGDGTLALSYNHRKAGMIRIDGRYPHYANNTVCFVANMPGFIGVGEARGAETIAKEITRRLLPAYVATLAKVMTTIAERKAYHAACEANAIRLGDIIGESPGTRGVRHIDLGNLELSFFDDDIHVSVTDIRDTSAKIEVTLPIADAGSVLKAIQKCREKRGTPAD